MRGNKLPLAGPPVDASKYQTPSTLSPAADGDELFTVKLRYKQPQADSSELVSFPVTDEGTSLGQASGDFQFAVAVAAFGMLLRDSEYKGTADYDLVLELAGAGRGNDSAGYRAEFLRLVKTAKRLQGS